MTTTTTTEKNSGKQPIWESSIRPLYPKCVWVDGGSYRNFILDHDITRRQRDFISLNGLSARRTLSCDGIEEDMQSLKLIGSSQVKRHRRESNLSDTTLFTNQRNITRISKNNSVQLIKKEFYEKFGNQMAIDEETAIGSDREYMTPSAIKGDASHSRGGGNASNIGSNCDEKHFNDEMDYSKNQLTERVLQWLDLAGRNTLNARNDNEMPKTNQPKRRIFTASETHKKKTVPQIHVSPKHSAAAPPIPQPPAILRRTESVHHLSLTFNNDDVGPSPNNGTPIEVSTERHALSFGEFFPTAYRCSKKFLAYRNGGAKVRHLTSANSQNVQQADNGRKPFRSKPKRIDSIENQYRSMIQRQILENNCNTQLAKRQLHIFMPSLPKKTIVTALSNSNNGDCDSCLSTILSSGVIR